MFLRRIGQGLHQRRRPILRKRQGRITKGRLGTNANELIGIFQNKMNLMLGLTHIKPFRLAKLRKTQGLNQNRT